ncbi:MAG: glycosyltransferase [Armatimonadota bacterium]
MKISVVIATHRRADVLGLVLSSLTAQTLPNEAFEVIVVEDFTNDKTVEVINDVKKKINIEYYACESPGAAVKRNSGVLKADADIILFLDDDMIASSSLLEEHLKYYSTGADGVLGHIEEDKNVKLNHFTSYLLENDLQNTYKGVDPENVGFGYFYTGNISIKKDVFNALGGFDVKFNEYGFEDTEFGYRLIKAGYVIKYNKDAEGYHHYFRDFESFLGRKYLMGRSAAYFAGLYPELKEKLSIHPRKLKETLLLNSLTKDLWLKKVRMLENKGNLTVKEKKKLYKIYEYLLNYYYSMGIKR